MDRLDAVRSQVVARVRTDLAIAETAASERSQHDAAVASLQHDIRREHDATDAMQRRADEAEACYVVGLLSDGLGVESH